MKKYVNVLVVISLLCTLLFISGCSNEDKNVIQTVKQVEILDNTFAYVHDMFWDEYMNEITEYFIASFDKSKHIKRNIPAPIDEKTHDEIVQKLMKDGLTVKNLTPQFDIKIEISKVYDYKNRKVVFAKSHVKDNVEGTLNLTRVNKYEFIKEDGSWKIMSIEMSYDYESNTGKLMFTKFNNEPIEYNQSFNPFEE